MERKDSISALSGPITEAAAARKGESSADPVLYVEPNDTNIVAGTEGEQVLVKGLIAGSAATPSHTADEAIDQPSTPYMGSVDVRLPCERPKSKKFNRLSSFQCYVDMDGWQKAFPQITMNDFGPGFSPGSFTNGQGLKLATYSWRQTAGPKAAIALFHSYTSYTLFDFLRHQPPGDARESIKEEDETWLPKYPGSWIEGFYRLGMNIYGMDHQSHGRSEGWRQWRCNVPKFDYLVNDALQFLNDVVVNDPSLPPDVPIVLLGYSMGGNVVIQTLGRIFSGEKDMALRKRVNQAVLLAPLMKIKLDLKTEIFLKVNRSLISCWLPNMRFSRADNSSDCPFLGWWYDKDPFTYSGRTKSSMVAALYDASRKLARILSKFPPELKLLCLQGTNDQTVDFRAPLKLYESPVKLDLFYLCGWSHYIPKHSGADKLLGLVLTWVEKSVLYGRVPSRAAQLRLLSLTGSTTQDAQQEAASTS